MPAAAPGSAPHPTTRSTRSAGSRGDPAPGTDRVGTGAADVVVIGAGVIGLTAAWRLAQAGAEVVVLDPAPARGASWVAAGMLAPVSETEEAGSDRARLLLAAARAWPAFAEELEAATGRSIGFVTGGTLTVAADQSDVAFVEHLVSLQTAQGHRVERLTASRCRSLVPSLAPGISGGALMPVDHQVDNRRLMEALLQACPSTGVKLLPLRACRLEPADEGSGGSGPAVHTEDGQRLVAGAVLLAAGAQSAGFPGVPEDALPPVRPVKGVVLRLRDPAVGDGGQGGGPDGGPAGGSIGGRPLLPMTVRGVVRGRTCYLVPRADGSVVIGATVEERGFDVSVEAWAVHDLLHDARTLVPGVDDLLMEEHIAGLRPGSPDNAPFVGWTGVPGLAVATGHFRNGILLAPLTAEAVRAALVGGPCPPAMVPFGARRALSDAPGPPDPSGIRGAPVAPGARGGGRRR